MIYSLRYVDGQTILKTIPQFLPDVKVTLDPRTNRVLVHASQSRHEVVEELIEALDIPPEAGAKEENTLEVYSLKYADGRTVADLVGEILPEIMFTMEHPRRMVVYASPSDQERLKKLVQRIDTTPERGAGDQIKVFSLVHTDAASIAQAVSGIIDMDSMRIAIDERTNSLLATGPEGMLSVLEALLLRMDQSPEAPRPGEALRVRVVWFGEGSPEDEPAKLDKDLQAVQDELTRIGVGPVRSMGQVMINTASGGEFQIGCSAKLGDDPADLKISGVLGLEQKSPLLKIEICAMGERKGGAAGSTAIVQFVELSTEIVAPLGHCIVLGVTPVQEKTLAFVVQVRSDDS